MSQDSEHDPKPQPRVITQPIKRGRAAVPDLPPEREPSAPHPSSVLGGAQSGKRAPSTRGTLFGQMFSPFATTQEVIKKPGTKP